MARSNTGVEPPPFLKQESVSITGSTGRRESKFSHELMSDKKYHLGEGVKAAVGIPDRNKPQLLEAERKKKKRVILPNSPAEKVSLNTHLLERAAMSAEAMISVAKPNTTNTINSQPHANGGKWKTRRESMSSNGSSRSSRNSTLRSAKEQHQGTHQQKQQQLVVDVDLRTNVTSAETSLAPSPLYSPIPGTNVTSRATSAFPSETDDRLESPQADLPEPKPRKKRIQPQVIQHSNQTPPKVRRHPSKGQLVQTRVRDSHTPPNIERFRRERESPPSPSSSSEDTPPPQNLYELVSPALKTNVSPLDKHRPNTTQVTVHNNVGKQRKKSILDRRDDPRYQPKLDATVQHYEARRKKGKSREATANDMTERSVSKVSSSRTQKKTGGGASNTKNEASDGESSDTVTDPFEDDLDPTFHTATRAASAPLGIPEHSANAAGAFRYRFITETKPTVHQLPRKKLPELNVEVRHPYSDLELLTRGVKNSISSVIQRNTEIPFNARDELGRQPISYREDGPGHGFIPMLKGLASHLDDAQIPPEVINGIPSTTIPMEFHRIEKTVLPNPEDVATKNTEYHEKDRMWHVTHFPSRVPASRNDAIVLDHWVNTMMEHLNQFRTHDVSETVKAAHWVYSNCVHELIRQVSVTCVERGSLLAKIWGAYVRLFEHVNKALEVEKEEYQKKVKEVQADREDVAEQMERQQLLVGYFNSIQAQLKEVRQKIMGVEDPQILDKFEQLEKDMKDLQKYKDGSWKKDLVEDKIEEDNKPPSWVVNDLSWEEMKQAEERKTAGWYKLRSYFQEKVFERHIKDGVGSLGYVSDDELEDERVDHLVSMNVDRDLQDMQEEYEQVVADHAKSIRELKMDLQKMKKDKMKKQLKQVDRTLSRQGSDASDVTPATTLSIPQGLISRSPLGSQRKIAGIVLGADASTQTFESSFGINNEQLDSARSSNSGSTNRKGKKSAKNIALEIMNQNRRKLLIQSVNASELSHHFMDYEMPSMEYVDSHYLEPDVLMSVIFGIYDAKRKSDAEYDEVGERRNTLVEYVFHHQVRRYGFPKMAKKKLLHVICSTQKEAANLPRAKMFGRFLGILQDEAPLSESAAAFFLQSYGYAKESDVGISYDEGKPDRSFTLSISRAEDIVSNKYKNTLNPVSRNSIMQKLESMVVTNEQNISLVDFDAFSMVLLEGFEANERQEARIWRAFFSAGDENQDGVLQFDEFEELVRFLDPKLQSEREVLKVFNEALKKSKSDDTLTPEALMSVSKANGLSIHSLSQVFDLMEHTWKKVKASLMQYFETAKSVTEAAGTDKIPITPEIVEIQKRIKRQTNQLDRFLSNAHREDLAVCEQMVQTFKSIAEDFATVNPDVSEGGSDSEVMLSDNEESEEESDSNA